MKNNHKMIKVFMGLCLIVTIFLLILHDSTQKSKHKDASTKSAENETQTLKHSSDLNAQDTAKEQSKTEELSAAKEQPYTKEQSALLGESDLGDTKESFYSSDLTDTLKARITGISYPKDDFDILISYEDLSYVHVLYHNFDGKIMEGELICNQLIANDLLEIFQALFEAQYQIESIKLIDEFNGDDEASMEANNSSCFNYRTIAGTSKISNHAYGLAIDINPFYNPYITTKNGQQCIQPAGSEPYCDRNLTFEHKITKDDLAYQLFTEHGFSWGGDWKKSKDYQHFEKVIEP